jgi:hypothetical protein
MFGTMRGAVVPARRSLLALIVAALAAAAPIAARADSGMIDVRTLPRLEGAVLEPSKSNYPELGLIYKVPGSLADMIAGVRKLLVSDGWTEYSIPFENSPRVGAFKKGAYGLRLFYMTDGDRTDRSAIDYSSDRLYVNLPFPEGATDIVYDSRSPYLSCVTSVTIEASLDFFRKQLVGLGWSPLSAADAASHWPNANLDEKLENGARAYFSRDTDDGGPKQSPVMLSLQPRADGKTAVEIKIAPFTLPQTLELSREEIGLPAPNHTAGFGSTGSADSVRRKVEGNVVAEIPAVLAFYRRELAARNWKEESSGAVVTTTRLRSISLPPMKTPRSGSAIDTT